MSTDITVTEAVAEATMHQLEAAGRSDLSPPSAEEAARASLQALASLSAGAKLADALLSLSPSGFVVPVDPSTLTATTDPFDGYSAAAAWYATHPRDGCGLRLGRQRDGSLLFAFVASTTAYSKWFATCGVDRRERADSNGRIYAEPTYRDFPRHVSVSWQPRPIHARTTSVTVGRSELEAASALLRTDRAGVGETGWLAVRVSPLPDGRRLRLRSRHIADGVELATAGVLPLAATRGDGWRLQSTG
ncbi:MAG: hypothetical protein H0V07_09215, partial [Propionibacteriales bacterium]|nr:hypothetical protein [Propionibacteriales bacterium]